MKFTQKVIIFHPQDKNRFLALKRSENSRTRPGKWDLPGGNVIYGQTHHESLLQEIQEEVGILKIEKLSPVYIFTDFNHEKNLYLIFIGYKAFLPENLAEPEIRLSHEHTEYQWMNDTEFLQTECEANLIEEMVKAVF
jgi:8-oxo-dGTP diphosphatase